MTGFKNTMRDVAAGRPAATTAPHDGENGLWATPEGRIQ